MPHYRLQAVREYTLTVEAESESGARQCFIDDDYDSMTVESDAVVSVVELHLRPFPTGLEPWPRESSDEWSERTRDRDGAEADAIAEQHERDRLGY